MAQKKETGKNVKVQDLAPKKDAKGGRASAAVNKGNSASGGGSLDRGGSLNRGGSALDGRGNAS